MISLKIKSTNLNISDKKKFVTILGILYMLNVKLDHNVSEKENENKFVMIPDIYRGIDFLEQFPFKSINSQTLHLINLKLDHFKCLVEENTDYSLEEATSNLFKDQSKILSNYQICTRLIRKILPSGC
jgi:hypothetical protein